MRSATGGHRELCDAAPRLRLGGRLTLASLTLTNSRRVPFRVECEPRRGFITRRVSEGAPPERPSVTRRGANIKAFRTAGASYEKPAGMHRT